MVQFQQCDDLKWESVLVSEKSLEALATVFDLQRKFGKKFCNFDGLTLEEKVHWTKEFKTHLDCEMTELLEQMPFKHWKDYSDYKINLDELHFEIVDMFHFFVSICLVWGLDAEKLVKMYYAKNRRNHDRQKDPKYGYIKEKEEA